jgi:hypothetical protein
MYIVKQKLQALYIHRTRDQYVNFRTLNTNSITMTMENAMNEIRGHYAKADAPERQKIQEQLRDLQDNLYTDWEVLFGMAMGVCCIHHSHTSVSDMISAPPLVPRPNRHRPQHFLDTGIILQTSHPQRLCRKDGRCALLNEAHPPLHGIFRPHSRDLQRHIQRE